MTARLRQCRDRKARYTSLSVPTASAATLLAEGCTCNAGRAKRKGWRRGSRGKGLRDGQEGLHVRHVPVEDQHGVILSTVGCHLSRRSWRRHARPRGACIGVALRQVQQLSALLRGRGPVCTQAFHARSLNDHRLHVSRPSASSSALAPERREHDHDHEHAVHVGARVRLTVAPALSRSPCTWSWCARSRLEHLRVRSASRAPSTVCSSSCFLETFVDVVTISETGRNAPCRLRDGAYSWHRHTVSFATE
jgi:hypothetical protein